MNPDKPPEVDPLDTDNDEDVETKTEVSKP